MFTYDEFLKNKSQQKNQQESQRIIHKNSNISDIKGNTTVDSDFTSVNKNKTPLLTINDIDIKKYSYLYSQKEKELNDLKNKYKELKIKFIQKNQQLKNNIKDFEMEKENNLNLKKLILQLLSNK